MREQKSCDCAIALKVPQHCSDQLCASPGRPLPDLDIVGMVLNAEQSSY